MYINPLKQRHKDVENKIQRIKNGEFPNLRNTDKVIHLLARISMKLEAQLFKQSLI